MINKLLFRKLLCVFIICVIGVCLTACDNKLKGIIIFNRNPITKDNVLDNANEFPVGKKFYYIFMTEKPVESEIIRVRIYKRAGTPVSMPITLVYSNDFKLQKEQVYYYNDYMVFYQPGEYFMAIYERDDMRKPMARNSFKITEY